MTTAIITITSLFVYSVVAGATAFVTYHLLEWRWSDGEPKMRCIFGSIFWPCALPAIAVYALLYLLYCQADKVSLAEKPIPPRPGVDHPDNEDLQAAETAEDDTGGQ